MGCQRHQRRAYCAVFFFLFFQSCIFSNEENPFSKSPILQKAYPNPDMEQVVIVFQLTDCPLCLFEAEYWSRAAKNGLSVVGVTSERDLQKLEIFSTDNEIQFPIVNNSEIMDRILNYLRQSGWNAATPVKVFLNRNHKILGVENGVKDVERQRAFGERAVQVFEGGGGT